MSASLSPAFPPLATEKPWPDHLFVVQVLPYLGDGGVEQSTLEMATWLQGQDIRHAVVSGGGPKAARLDEIGVPHWCVPVQRKTPWMVLINAIRLRRLLRQHQVTLVHVRSRAPAWAAWLATRGLRIQGRPVGFVSTFHGTYGSSNVLKRCYNRVMLRGPVVIANSEFIRAHLQQVYGVAGADIIVAPRGIEPARFDPAQHQTNRSRILHSLHVPTEAEAQPLITLVGRLTRWKGQHVLLDALAGMTDIAWHAVLVGAPEGDGAYARELMAQRDRLGLQDRVTLTGSRKDIPEILSVSAIAVSTSTRAEAFGRVAIEAQAAGLPVVASALGGALETVRDGETGYLVAPNAPQVLADKLRLLLTQPGLAATLGRNGHAWVRNHFTVENCCQQEARAYRRVLDWQKAAK